MSDRGVLLEIENLRVAFPGTDRPAVDGVSFVVHAGETLGIVGESGSGKSMTCRAIQRLLPEAARQSGKVSYRGRDVLSLEGEALRKLRGRDISMIFQNPSSHLDPLMRVGDQVSEALRHHIGLDRQAAWREAVKLLDDVKIPEPARWARAYPHQLSGGMKQRVMIAAALACQPSLLIADEPTTALDVTVQAGILQLLRELQQERNVAIIFVSHDLGAIAEICDRVLVMRHGKVVEQGPLLDVVTRPHQAYTRELVNSQPDRLPRSRVKTGPAPRREALIEIEDLQIDYGGGRSFFNWLYRTPPPRPAVEAVSFTVERGDAIGIVGESGSGKTTVARGLVGLVSPRAGEIRHDGTRLEKLMATDRVAYLRAVQLVYQHPQEALNPRMTVAESIGEPLRRHRLCAPDAAGEQVDALMREVELQPDLKYRKPHALSGGQCQRVAVARALAMRPEVLIADEITSALDVTIQAQVLDLLKKLRRERGLTVLFISHDLGVIRYFCNKVVVMRGGRVVESGETETLFERPRMDYTRALIAAIPHLPSTLEGKPVSTQGVAH